MPPFSSPHNPVSYPALYLYPLNDSFIPKHISLINNQRVKIGRQTNAKTVPAERNGYFDSKVLSRQHAEVWEEGGKIFIKDVKSSNGTFINGERLSPEGVESEPFDLKTDDIVEFGIDIVGEDNKTIIHHKVAARVVCVFNDQDAQAAARAEAQQSPSSYGALGVPGPSGAAGAFSFASGATGAPNGLPGAQRRTTMQPQGLVGMGGMGGNARPPGKSGLTFDHILSRLQGELQKSRETGAELHSLQGAMTDIHETLSGNVPANAASFPQTLPPVVPPQASQPAESSTSAPAGAQAPKSQDSTVALSDLQAQLFETQRSLATHVEKIRSLESMLAEHEAIKREVSAMRDMMEERKRELEHMRVHTQSPTRLRRLGSHSDEHPEEYSDDDDTRSIVTVVPHELERVDEEDEEQIAAEEEEERRRRTDEVRPRTPEPTGVGMDDDEHDAEPAHHHPATLDAPQSHPVRESSPIHPAQTAVPDDLAQRLLTLENQLGSALELSRTLQAQHTTAQSTISMLESKVSTLENLVQVTRSQVQAQGETQQQLIQAAEAERTAAQDESPVAAIAAAYKAQAEERAKERESLTEMLNEWKKNVEGRWSGVQEEWNEERERLRRAKEEWETRVLAVEAGFESAMTKVNSGLASVTSFQVAQHQQANGHARLSTNGAGLFTPPSPRSLSSDSIRTRQKKRRSSSARGRSRSRSSSPAAPVNGSMSASDTHVPEDSSASTRIRRRSWGSESSGSEPEERLINGSAKPHEGEVRKSPAVQYPITPEPSLLEQPISGSSGVVSAMTESRTKDHPKDLPHINNVSTAFGIIVLGIAAAAVLWRVKPEASV